MKIEYLADYPQFISVVNKWIFNEFSYLVPHTKEKDWLIALKKRLHKNRIPTSFIVIVNDQPVGFACLIEHDMDTHRHLTPWLAGVFVIPDQRKKGIGSQLVRRVMSEAKNLNIKTLYLFTPDRKHFYKRLGWQVIEQTTYHGYEVFIMSIQLDSNERSGEEHSSTN